VADGGVADAVLGVKWGPAKLWPQASQNWPFLGVPQRGQGSEAEAAGSGQADDGAPDAGDEPVAWLPG
jgi:hypothetical protein